MSAPFRRNASYIAQGQQAVGGVPGEMIATTLGSCVAVCLWDPEARVGGMNHILLPEDEGNWSRLNNVGGSAMDRLVNGLVKRGAERSRLRAKVFGGAAMITGLSDIGRRNADFALDYLAREGMPCDARSIGGGLARQVKFWPYDGRARQRLVADFREPERAGVGVATNGVELF